MNWLSDEWLLRNWSSMGINAATHQKKCHSKTICTLQPTVRVNTLETGILSNSSENMQVVLVLKEESRCL